MCHEGDPSVVPSCDRSGGVGSETQAGATTGPASRCPTGVNNDHRSWPSLPWRGGGTRPTTATACKCVYDDPPYGTVGSAMERCRPSLSDLSGDS
jgi:hypothetical protein